MTMTLVPVPTACEKCGGRLWDNRESKKNPKAPDFKCRDKACDGVFWPLRNGNVWADQAPAAPAANGKQAISLGPRIPEIDDEPYGATLPVPPKPAPAPAAVPAAGDPFDVILTRHARCLEHVVENEVRYLKSQNIVATGETVSALVAQLFIECSRRGL